MAGKKRLYYVTWLLLPLLFAALLFICYGLPASERLTVTTYYAQILSVALTIAGVPLSLKYVTKERCGARYEVLCALRMVCLSVTAVLELLLYYFLCVTPMFYYLAIMTWLAMFFALPKMGNEEK